MKNIKKIIGVVCVLLVSTIQGMEKNQKEQKTYFFGFKELDPGESITWNKAAGFQGFRIEVGRKQHPGVLQHQDCITFSNLQVPTPFDNNARIEKILQKVPNPVMSYKQPFRTVTTSEGSYQVDADGDRVITDADDRVASLRGLLTSLYEPRSYSLSTLNDVPQGHGFRTQVGFFSKRADGKYELSTRVLEGSVFVITPRKIAQKKGEESTLNEEKTRQEEEPTLNFITGSVDEMTAEFFGCKSVTIYRKSTPEMLEEKAERRKKKLEECRQGHYVGHEDSRPINTSNTYVLMGFPLLVKNGQAVCKAISTINRVIHSTLERNPEKAQTDKGLSYQKTATVLEGISAHVQRLFDKAGSSEHKQMEVELKTLLDSPLVANILAGYNADDDEFRQQKLRDLVKIAVPDSAPDNHEKILQDAQRVLDSIQLVRDQLHNRRSVLEPDMLVRYNNADTILNQLHANILSAWEALEFSDDDDDALDSLLRLPYVANILVVASAKGRTQKRKMSEFVKTLDNGDAPVQNGIQDNDGDVFFDTQG